MRREQARIGTATAATLAVCFAMALACRGPEAARPPDPGPLAYRLYAAESWSDAADGRLLDELEPRYPEFFELVLDGSRNEEDRLLTLRDDLESAPVTRRNYDALNAVAVGYFVINERAESHRGEDLGYMSESFRAAKLLAVPWRAYGEVRAYALRDAILDFFEDAANGRKPGTQLTAPRVGSIVESLERKEDDPDRLARMRAIVADLSARYPIE